jgi:hypothetical protein
MTHKLLSFLADFLSAHVLDEKIFVVPSYQIGHQIGESLTKAGNSWVNLRFMTLPLLAHEVVGAELYESVALSNIFSLLYGVIKEIFISPL